VDGTVSASGAAQGTQALGQAQINLALAEGSDAAGATASALQAANAAATAAPATRAGAGDGERRSPAVAGDGPSASSLSATAPISAAVLAASDSSGARRATAALMRTSDAERFAGRRRSAANGAAALQQLTAAPASVLERFHPRRDAARERAGGQRGISRKGVSDRVSFAVDNNWSSAKLQVNPPQLGPIDLQIAVQGDHAQVMMSTHSAVTREALESSLPKLKEMLGSQGFTQVSVDISQRSFQDRSAFNQPYTWAKPASGTAPVAAPVSAPSNAAIRTSIGVVDAYA
jgi:flagellar hook-length control protein FliK